MRYFVTLGERELEVELGPDGIRVDGDAITADLVEMDGTDVYSLLLGERSHRILASGGDGDEWALHLSGRSFRAQVVDERTRTIREMSGVSERHLGPKALHAPMPGLVVRVEVRVGEDVAPGQGLVIVEAMKMENELKSPGGGRIGKIHVEPGQTVEKDQILVEFEAPELTAEKGSEG